MGKSVLERGRSQPDQPGDQTSGGDRSKWSIDVGQILKNVALGVVVIILLSFLLTAGSCSCRAFSWARSKAKEDRMRVEELRKTWEEEASRRETERKMEAERQVVVEEERASLEDIQVSVRGWLSGHYAIENGWINLNSRLRQTGAPNEVSLIFPVIARAGIHLPPLDLALAPAKTLFVVEDKELHWGFGRSLRVLYQGTQQHTRTNCRVSLSSTSPDTPCFLLEVVSDFNKGLPSASTATLTVQYVDASVARLDKNIRLSLEKVFREEDLGRPIKVMDLPSVIDGIPVSWDLVVRCYPAWETYPDTNIGRWMPSPNLDSTYLDHFSPVLSISHSDKPDDDVDIVSADKLVVSPSTKENFVSRFIGDFLESVASKAPQELSESPDEFIWQDNESLLSDGVFLTSSEDMIARIRSAGRGKGDYGEGDWKGGESLYINVKRAMDRYASDSKSVEVTVRVILGVRVRT